MQNRSLWVGVGIGIVVGVIIGALVFRHKALPVGAGGATFPGVPVPATVAAGMPGNVPGNPADINQAIAIGATNAPVLSPEDLKKVQDYAKKHGGNVVVDMDTKGRIKNIRSAEKK